MKITLLVWAMFAILLICVLFVIGFAAAYVGLVAKYSFIDHPLNKHNPSFMFLDRLGAFRFKTMFKQPKILFTSYNVLLLLTFLMILCGAAIGSMYLQFMSANPGERSMDRKVVILSIGPVVLLIITMIHLFAARGFVSSELKTIDDVNKAIRSKMYNNSAFNVLSEDKRSRLHQISTYRGLLSNLTASQDKTPDVNELAKAMFTVNLYLFMYDNGSKHANIQEALKPFSNFNRLTSASFVKYFSPKSAEMPNRIQEIYMNSFQDVSDTKLQEDIKKAVEMASRWVLEVNSKLDISYGIVPVVFTLTTFGLLLTYLLALKFMFVK